MKDKYLDAGRMALAISMFLGGLGFIIVGLYEISPFMAAGLVLVFVSIMIDPPS